MGTLHNEYDSNGLCDANDTVAEFDMDSPYCNLQGGSGYVWNMAEGHGLDICSKVYLDQGAENLRPFEHEFSGTCASTIYGHPVAASFEGRSGMGEPGLMMKDSEDLPLSINPGVQGYSGQKKSLFGMCIVNRGCKACVPVPCI